MNKAWLICMTINKNKFFPKYNNDKGSLRFDVPVISSVRNVLNFTFIYCITTLDPFNIFSYHYGVSSTSGFAKIQFMLN